MHSKDLWITLSYHSIEKNKIKYTFAKSTEQITDGGGRLFICIHSLFLIYIVFISIFSDHLQVTWQSEMFSTVQFKKVGKSDDLSTANPEQTERNIFLFLFFSFYSVLNWENGIWRSFQEKHSFIDLSTLVQHLIVTNINLTKNKICSHICLATSKQNFFPLYH